MEATSDTVHETYFDRLFTFGHDAHETDETFIYMLSIVTSQCNGPMKPQLETGLQLRELIQYQNDLILCLCFWSNIKVVTILLLVEHVFSISFKPLKNAKRIVRVLINDGIIEKRNITRLHFSTVFVTIMLSLRLAYLEKKQINYFPLFMEYLQKYHIGRPKIPSVLV